MIGGKAQKDWSGAKSTDSFSADKLDEMLKAGRAGKFVSGLNYLSRERAKKVVVTQRKGYEWFFDWLVFDKSRWQLIKWSRIKCFVIETPWFKFGRA